mgnify:CR=1 FL=1
MVALKTLNSKLKWVKVCLTLPKTGIQSADIGGLIFKQPDSLIRKNIFIV